MLVTVTVGVSVGVLVTLTVGVTVGVFVTLTVGVTVGVGVLVVVTVGVGVLVGVGLGLVGLQSISSNTLQSFESTSNNPSAGAPTYCGGNVKVSGADEPDPINTQKLPYTLQQYALNGGTNPVIDDIVMSFIY